MKFTVSTKPLKESLKLCIIDANVSEFYTVSKLACITASADTLKINHAANLILSEVTLHGLGEGDDASIIVDPVLLKKLVSTFTASQIIFEFTDNALVLHAGKSKFTLPMIASTDDAELPKPASLSNAEITSGAEISKNEWKFIKDYQMYALTSSDMAPIYDYVYVGADGAVLVSDFKNSLFTYSRVSKLGRTSLLTDTIVNLFNSLPEGAKVVSHESAYSIVVNTDSFSYLSEFTPILEPEKVEAYSADIIINTATFDETNASAVQIGEIMTILKQAELLATEKAPTIECLVEHGQITFKNARANGTVAADGGPEQPYNLIFPANILKSVISNCSESTIQISPTLQEGKVVGIVIKSDKLTVVLAGMD